MKIGPHTIDNPLALAPMVGITDRFFRKLCRELGAGYVMTEMIAATPAMMPMRVRIERSLCAPIAERAILKLSIHVMIPSDPVPESQNRNRNRYRHRNRNQDP